MSSKRTSEDITIVCRAARRRFAALAEQTHSARIIPIKEKLSVTERAATERHLQTCARCELEYRLFTLGHAAMDAAASRETISPDEHFFKALRARIAREGEATARERHDESWAAAIMLTARQMIPAMAMLLLLIIGATFLWNTAPAKWNAAPSPGGQALDRVTRRERVVLPDLYDYPAPTAADVLETLVAIEEKKNGK
jgi:anti-sigma factor RsiW